jgi:general bacterial porin, GBP family
MNKKLMTAAVASALALPAGLALADVTVYGTIDTGFRNQGKVVNGAATATERYITDGSRTTNRWGLKGSEDLGGGLMANFTLEGQYASDTGGGPGSAAGVGNQGLFQRKSIVGLSSNGGWSVDLGRDYTTNFKTQGVYDPMSYTYTGITPTAGRNTAGVRFSNLITGAYRFGTGGVRVDYVLGETVGANTGDGLGVNFDYVWGPVTFAVASSSVHTSATVKTGTGNIGVKWDIGPIALRFGLSNTHVDTGTAATDTDSPMMVLGAQYAFSPTLNGRIGYYTTKFETNSVKTADDKLAIIALDYYLSKRTTLYIEFDRRSVSNVSGTPATASVMGATVADGATAVGVGIAHAF